MKDSVNGYFRVLQRAEELCREHCVNTRGYHTGYQSTEKPDIEDGKVWLGYEWQHPDWEGTDCYIEHIEFQMSLEEFCQVK